MHPSPSTPPLETSHNNRTYRRAGSSWVLEGRGAKRNTPVSLGPARAPKGARGPRAGLATIAVSTRVSVARLELPETLLCLTFGGRASPVLTSFQKELGRKPRGQKMGGERPALESLEENSGCRVGKDPAATTGQESLETLPSGHRARPRASGSNWDEGWRLKFTQVNRANWGAGTSGPSLPRPARLDQTAGPLSQICQLAAWGSGQSPLRDGEKVTFFFNIFIAV